MPSSKRREYTCVFWNPDANNSTGGWSRSGVARLNFTETENGTQVTCETVHLTSFVVLVSLVDVVSIYIFATIISFQSLMTIKFKSSHIMFM